MAKRNRVSAPTPAAPRLTKRQLSRLARERRQRRLLYWSMAGAAVLVVGLIVFGILREQVLVPNETVLTVNGAAISRETYWKVRRFELAQQLQQLQFQAQFGGQSAQFARQRLETLQNDLRNYRSGPLDTLTLEKLATNELLRQRAGQLGVTVDEAAIQAEIERDFAPPPATPTPVTTTEATQTAAAATAAAALTPQPSLSPTRPPITGTPGTPAPTSTPTTGPTATSTPFVTPTPTVPSTPLNEAARATANATFRDQLGGLRQIYGMSAEDYRALVVRPKLLEEAIKRTLAERVPDVQPQVRAVHILVADEAAAGQVREAVAQGADFAALARERSTDPGSKEQGGDLGWFPKGIMAAEFEQAAFALEPNVVGEPVKTQFGVHLIKVLEKSDSRPVTPDLLGQLRDNAYDKWLKEQRETSTVVSEVTLPNFAPRPTPTVGAGG